MTIAVTPNQIQIQEMLRQFILTLLPAGTEVIESQDNRVPEPAGDNYVLMTTIRRPRLATNRDKYVDDFYIGSIAGTILTVTDIGEGSVKTGAQFFGIDVADNSAIGTQISGPTGGIGTYNITPAQTLTSRVLASGDIQSLQPTEIVIQLDFHSADVATSADYAQIISTMLRDDYAVEQFKSQTPSYDVQPLYADDPKQIPFISGEAQFETRWIVEAHLQANQVVSGIPQQFADQVKIGLVDVDAVYPPQGA